MFQDVSVAVGSCLEYSHLGRSAWQSESSQISLCRCAVGIGGACYYICCRYVLQRVDVTDAHVYGNKVVQGGTGFPGVVCTLNVVTKIKFVEKY
jgi:hypothetical protein